jgi:hypothetical protein
LAKRYGPKRGGPDGDGLAGRKERVGERPEVLGWAYGRKREEAREKTGPLGKKWRIRF